MNSTRPPLPNLPEGIRPVIIWQIPPESEESHCGKIQFKMEDIDGDCFGARNEKHLREMLQHLGTDGVTKEQMDRIRKRRLAAQRWRARQIRNKNKKHKKQ